jgi:hypothetical protein
MDSRNLDLDKRLDRLERIEEENNEMLHGLTRRARIATAVGIARWAIVILVTLGGYYVLQQYIAKVTDLYTKVNNSANVIDTSQDSVKKAIEDFKNMF